MAALNLATHAGVNFLQPARTSYSGGRSGTRINNNQFSPNSDGNFPGRRWDNASKGSRMPCCSTGDNHLCRSADEPPPKELQLKSKSPAPGAPLGVLPIHGPVKLHDAVRLQRVTARGGLAGWQRKRVLEYIEEHLSETITLSMLSALAQLSPYHFARAFKKTLGVPPHRYHMNRRVERAKVLLAGRSVTEVALAVGYAETSSFSSGFRRATGMSPTEFRRGLT
jgi:AraC-like DNA-binding protein